MQALSGTAKILRPCGIRLKATELKPLEAAAAFCDLPDGAAARRPLLRELARPLRLKNLQGLSLFVLPTPGQARYAFSVIDESAGAGCGSPRKPALLAEVGSVFITDFGLSADPSYASLLLAHEIAHELTMKQHPTHAPRGSLLADHAAEMGPRIPDEDCACMRQSPLLTP